MMSVADMKALLCTRGKDVEAYLATCLDGRDMPQRLKDSMLYSLQAGGKRLRPVLCLSTAALCGLSPQRSMPFASAIEMIHTATLVHDDVLDGALNIIKNNCTRMVACSTQPTTYTEGNATYALADVTVESRDVQHTQMVNEVIKVLAKWPGWERLNNANS